MRQLPDGKVPKMNSDGEKYRELQLVYQLPKQDLSVNDCHHLENAEQRASFTDFVSARNDIALDVAQALDGVKGLGAFCYKCRKDIPQGALAVVAPRFGLSVLWHPACFTCATCEELLVSCHSDCVRTVYNWF